MPPFVELPPQVQPWRFWYSLANQLLVSRPLAGFNVLRFALMNSFDALLAETKASPSLKAFFDTMTTRLQQEKARLGDSLAESVQDLEVYAAVEYLKGLEGSEKRLYTAAHLLDVLAQLEREGRTLVHGYNDKALYARLKAIELLRDDYISLITRAVQKFKEGETAECKSLTAKALRALEAQNKQ